MITSLVPESGGAKKRRAARQTVHRSRRFQSGRDRPTSQGQHRRIAEPEHAIAPRARGRQRTERFDDRGRWEIESSATKTANKRQRRHDQVATESTAVICRQPKPASRRSCSRAPTPSPNQQCEHDAIQHEQNIQVGRKRIRASVETTMRQHQRQARDCDGFARKPAGVRRDRVGGQTAPRPGGATPTTTYQTFRRHHARAIGTTAPTTARARDQRFRVRVGPRGRRRPSWVEGRCDVEDERAEESPGTQRRCARGRVRIVARSRHRVQRARRAPTWPAPSPWRWRST